jgi:hypothetical protein
VIASAYINISDLPKVTSENFTSDGFGRRYAGPRLRWFHFYGANTNIKSGKAANLMNKYPNLGIAYRGCLLGSMRLITEPKNYPECVRVKPINYSTPKSLMPIMCSYYLRVMFYLVTDIEKNVFNKYSARVSFGSHTIKVIIPLTVLFT